MLLPQMIFYFPPLKTYQPASLIHHKMMVILTNGANKNVACCDFTELDTINKQYMFVFDDVELEDANNSITVKESVDNGRYFGEHYDAEDVNFIRFAPKFGNFLGGTVKVYEIIKEKDDEEL